MGPTYAAAVLVPLPPQPDDVPWPTDEWPTGDPEPGTRLDRLLDEVMGTDGPLLPEGWVDHGRYQRSTDPENGNGYGAQWWVVPDDPRGSFWANGYEGQAILVCPALDLIVVRLGKTPAERSPALQDWRARVVAAFSG